MNDAPPAVTRRGDGCDAPGLPPQNSAPRAARPRASLPKLPSCSPPPGLRSIPGARVPLPAVRRFKNTNMTFPGPLPNVGGRFD
jgi:hypothetical protein